jgi:hypothetical protein
MGHKYMQKAGMPTGMRYNTTGRQTSSMHEREENNAQKVESKSLPGVDGSIALKLNVS